MKKTIGIVLASLSLLLAGSSISASVASASTEYPETIDIYPKNNLGEPLFVRAQRDAVFVNLKTKTIVYATSSFDGKSGVISKVYPAGTNLRGTLYHNTVFNKFSFLIIDPSTNLRCWVNPSLVETV